jgi:hypothetical protein
MRCCLVAYGAAAATALAVVSCGTQRDDDAVVRVGDASISEKTIDHWSSVLAGGRLDPASARGPGLERRRRAAIQFLVTSNWLLGEAGKRAVTLSSREIRRQVDASQRAAFPGGEAERRAFLDATGETSADMELEAKAELASARLEQRAKASAPPATMAAVAAYYTRHASEFTVPELREVLITNRKSAAAGDEVIREIQSGRSAAAHLQREVFVWPSSVDNPYKSLERSIHAATLHALTGPVKQRNDFFVFEVRRIVPSTRRTLPQVAGEIRRRLTREARRRALAAFVAAWRAKWIVKTSCRAGYVVQKCSQYKGPRSPEDALKLD